MSAKTKQNSSFVQKMVQKINTFTPHTDNSISLKALFNLLLNGAIHCQRHSFLCMCKVLTLLVELTMHKLSFT